MRLGTLALLFALALGGVARAQPPYAISRITSMDKLWAQLNQAFAGVQTPACNNAAGDGALIQAAVATGGRVHIVGQCLLDQPVTFTTAGQEFYGDDRTTSVLNVASILTTGALILPNASGFPTLSGVAGPNIHDIGISFAQANSSTRAGLTAFTPAIYAQNAGRFKLTKLRITNAMVGVDARSATGGFTADDVEVSAMSAAFLLDVIGDSVKLSHIHIWPFGILGTGCGLAPASATGECLLYAQTNLGCTPETTSGTDGPIGVWSGLMSDLHWSESLVLVGQGACFVTTTGITVGDIAGVSFDTYSGIINQTGNLRVTGGYFFLVNDNYQAILQSGGSIQASNIFFETLGAGSAASFENLGGSMMLTNLYANVGTVDQMLIQADTAGFLEVRGLQILTSGSPTLTVAKVCVACFVSGPAAIITGVQPLSAVTAGTLIKVGVDNYHRIIGNGLLGGWANSCPAITHAVYANNGTAAVATCN